MYIAIRRYGVDPKDVPGVLTRVRDGFLPIVKDIEGLIAYQVVDAGRGMITTIGTFQNPEAAQRSDEVAKQWTGENLVGLLSGIPDTTRGKVVAST